MTKLEELKAAWRDARYAAANAADAAYAARDAAWCAYEVELKKQEEKQND